MRSITKIKIVYLYQTRQRFSTNIYIFLMAIRASTNRLLARINTHIDINKLLNYTVIHEKRVHSITKLPTYITQYPFHIL